MSDLTEFLLARIAEDETGAHVMRGREAGLDVPVSQWLGFLPGRGSFAARMLAECEAKRRIVKQVSDVAWGGYAVRDVILELLALPYADHPDYRQEWAAG